MRKSRFSRRRQEDNIRGNFREIVVKFGSEGNGYIIMLLEVLKICVLQTTLDNRRNNTLIRRLFDKRNDVYSRACICQI
jgi:hypothetical protein